MKRVDVEDLQGGERLLQWPHGEVLAWTQNRRLGHYWTIVCEVRRNGRLRVKVLTVPHGMQVKVEE